MAESRRYYHGGKTLVVDRLVELKRSGSVERMKSSLGIAMNQRELDRLRNELENMGADGIVSPAEKQSLKREWGNLESSYYKTSGQFSDDPDLSGSAPWALLAPAFATLSSIMEKVLADMDSSYTDADLSQIDDLFYSCWTYINRCSALYDSRSSFGSRYELRFVGNREFNGSTTINVVVYSKTLGQNVAFPASEFDWFYSDTGDKVATGTLNPTFTTAMLGSGTSREFWCQWTHDISGETGEESGTSVARIVAFITLSIAKITQFQWSNAEKEDQLNKDSSAWSNTRPDQPDGVQYVWIRESVDDGKTWTYYRETGLVGPEGPQGDKGDKGDTGEQGPQGEPGKDGEDGKSPEYLYKYTKTSEKDAYKTGAAAFTYGGMLMTYGGTALTAGMGGWSKTLPDGPQYADDHLWMKIINPDGTETIVPPASECSISIQGQTSYQADRHVASADQTLEYAVTRNKIDVGECQWSINTEAYNLGCGFLSDSDTPPSQTAMGEVVQVFVPMGFDLRQFTITALVIYVSASLTVSEANAVAKREYLGIYPQTIDGVEYRFPLTAKDGKPLEVGDSITMREKDAEGNFTGTDVYVYMGIDDGQPVWTNDVNDMPTDKIYEIAMDSNYDISSLANRQELEPVTQGAAWLFQRNIVAFNMFTQRMFAEEIIIQAGGSIHSNGYDKDGLPVFDENGERQRAFYIGSDGTTKFYDTEINGKIESYDSNGLLLKTQEGQDGATLQEPEQKDRFMVYRGSIFLSGEESTFEPYEAEVSNVYGLKFSLDGNTMFSNSVISYLPIDSVPTSSCSTKLNNELSGKITLGRDSDGISSLPIWTQYFGAVGRAIFTVPQDIDGFDIYVLISCWGSNSRAEEFEIEIYRNDTKIVEKSYSANSSSMLDLIKLDLSPGDEVSYRGIYEIYQNHWIGPQLWFFLASKARSQAVKIAEIDGISDADLSSIIMCKIKNTTWLDTDSISNFPGAHIMTLPYDSSMEIYKEGQAINFAVKLSGDSLKIYDSDGNYLCTPSSLSQSAFESMQSDGENPIFTEFSNVFSDMQNGRYSCNPLTSSMYVNQSRSYDSISSIILQDYNRRGGGRTLSIVGRNTRTNKFEIYSLRIESLFEPSNVKDLDENHFNISFVEEPRGIAVTSIVPVPDSEGLSYIGTTDNRFDFSYLGTVIADKIIVENMGYDTEPGQIYADSNGFVKWRSYDDA